MSTQKFETHEYWLLVNPRWAPKRSKTGPKRYVFIARIDLLFKLWNILREPSGHQDRSKIEPEIDQNLSCGNIPQQDHPKRRQDRPKTAPRDPKTARRGPKN